MCAGNEDHRRVHLFQHLHVCNVVANIDSTNTYVLYTRGHLNFMCSSTKTRGLVESKALAISLIDI